MIQNLLDYEISILETL